MDQNSGDVVLTHDNKRVLVTHFDMRRAMQQAKAAAITSKMYARLVVLDRRRSTSSPRARYASRRGIAVAAKDDSFAAIACYGSDEIAIVELGNPELPTAHVPIAATAGVPGAPRFGPYSIAIAPDQKRAIVADMESADVRIIDLVARQFLADSAIPLGARDDAGTSCRTPTFSCRFKTRRRRA